MKKKEFKALNKAPMLELLQENFEDPDNAFLDMNKYELTQFGLDNWDAMVFEEEPEEEELEEEVPAEVIKGKNLATDLYGGNLRESSDRPKTLDLG